MKQYEGYIAVGRDEIYNQYFYQIDSEHAVGSSDFCVYQILDLEDIFNYDEDKNDEIIEDSIVLQNDLDFRPILIFVDFENKKAFNYAEDDEIKEFIKYDAKNEVDNYDTFINEYDSEMIVDIIEVFYDNFEDKKLSEENLWDHVWYTINDSLLKL